MSDFVNGSRLDERPVNQVQGSMRRTRNLMYKEGKKSLRNEYGFTDHIVTVNGSPATSVGGSIIGIIEANTKAVVFSVRLGGFSEIGILDENGDYNTVLRSQYLNFSLDNPIQGTHFYNYKGELVACWWDGISDTSNRPRILNLNNTPFDVTGAYEFVNPDDVNKTLLFPDYSYPTIGLNDIKSSGGFMKSGVYYFTLSYLVDDFDTTEYTQMSNPIPIGRYLNELEPNRGLQHGADELVNASIDLNLTNLDTRFDRLKLSVLKRVGNVYEAAEVATLKIPTSGTINYTYNGHEESSIEDVSTLLGLRTTFEKVKTGDNVRNRLIPGNVVQKERLNYQCYANNIGVSWVTTEDDVEEFSDPVVMFDGKGLMIDEVYALYIGFILKDGTRSELFHIPGRRAGLVTINEDYSIPNALITNTTCNGSNQIEIEYSDFQTRQLPFNGANPPTWTDNFTGLTGTVVDVSVNGNVTSGNVVTLDYDCSGGIPAGFGSTGIVINFNAAFNENSSFSTNPLTNLEERDISPNARHFHLRETASAGGVMGYWENQDEFYPDTEDFDVCGLVGGVPTNLSQLNPADPNYVQTLRGDKVRHHKVPGSRVLYSTDDYYATKAIGLSFNNIQIPADIADQVESFYFGFAKRDVRNSTVLGTSIILPQAQYKWHVGSGSSVEVERRGYRVYPYHLMTDTPVVGVNYIKHDFRLKDYATIEDEDQHDVEIQVGDVYDEWFTIEPIHGHEYLTSDNSAHNLFDNIGREACLFLNSVTRVSGFPVYSPFYWGIEGMFDAIANDAAFNQKNFRADQMESIQYGTLRSFLENIYVNFYDQDLGSTNKFFPVSGAGTYTGTDVYNWDTFNGERMQYYKRNVGSTYMSTDNDADKWVYKFRIFHREYTTNNIFFNQLEGGVATETFVPHTYNYDKSYNSINDRKTLVAYNPYITYVNKLPYRVYLSIPQQDEDKSLAWRTIYATSYYEMPRNRGQIWCIRGQNLTAYIQMEGALFQTSVNDVIKTDTLIAYLQASDLFDRPPAEIMYSNDGYIGCNDMFSCLVTPQGYFVYDRKRQRVFNVKDGKAGIVSNVGYKEYFLDNGVITDNSDNPYINKGTFIVYDDEFERMIINISKDEEYHTLSLDTTRGFWIGNHTYNPLMMYSLRDGTYAVGLFGRILKINDRTKFGRYFGSNAEETYFEIVFNHMRDVKKTFNQIDWETEVLDANGVDLHEKTLTHIMVYDSHKCTGIVELNTGNTFFDIDADRNRGAWHFAKFRDLVNDVTQPFLDGSGEVLVGNINSNKPFFDKSKFIGKFIVVRFIYDNVDGNEITINNVGINYSHYRK